MGGKRVLKFFAVHDPNLVLGKHLLLPGSPLMTVFFWRKSLIDVNRIELRGRGGLGSGPQRDHSDKLTGCEITGAHTHPQSVPKGGVLTKGLAV